jgi:hypothetical protein
VRPALRHHARLRLAQRLVGAVVILLFAALCFFASL